MSNLSPNTEVHLQKHELDKLLFEARCEAKYQERQRVFDFLRRTVIAVDFSFLDDEEHTKAVISGTYDMLQKKYEHLHKINYRKASL